MEKFEQHFLKLEFDSNEVASIFLDSCSYDTDKEVYTPKTEGNMPALHAIIVNTALCSWKESQREINSLQKKLKKKKKNQDKARYMIEQFFDKQTTTPSPREYSNFIADIKNILLSKP